MRRLIYRIVGPPPERGATREQQLRWVRKFYRLNLAAVVIVVVFAVAAGSTFLWIVAAAGAIWWVAGVASVSVSIRRAARQR